MNAQKFSAVSMTAMEDSIRIDFDHGSGGFSDRDSYSCNSSAYLKQGSACSEVHAVGKIEKARGKMVVQAG